jgi:hypothetical protein
MMGATSGAGTAFPSGTLEFRSGFIGAHVTLIHSSKHNICLSPMIFLFRSSILAILTDDMLVILQKLIHSTLIKKFVPIKLHQFLLTCKYQARIRKRQN